MTVYVAVHGHPDMWTSYFGVTAADLLMPISRDGRMLCTKLGFNPHTLSASQSNKLLSHGVTADKLRIKATATPCDMPNTITLE
jgi:hypothetical protein